MIGQFLQNSQLQALLFAVDCCYGGKFEIRYRYGKRLQYKIMAELGNEEYFSAEGVLRLKEENEALQNNLELAGELGKSLLENNQELERKLEEVNSEHISSLEKIEVVISYSEVKKKKNGLQNTRPLFSSCTKRHTTLIGIPMQASSWPSILN